MNAPSPASYKLFLRLFGAQSRKVLLGPFFLGLILLVTQAASAATYTVTNTADSGVGSLRDALTSVNAGAGGDIINFSGVTGTITLSSVLAINKSVTINGPGASLLTISGNDAVEVFNIPVGAGAVTISALTIAHGFFSAGGGIQTNNTLTVNNCTFSDNASNNNIAVNVGGAINGGVSSILKVNNSTFVNNRASGTGSPSGGAIWTSGTLVEVNDSTFFGNSAGGGGGAIAVFIGNRLTVRNSTIVGNSAATNGGIGVSSPNAPTVTNSIVSGNTGGDCSKCSAGGNNFMGGTAALGPLQYNGGPTQTMLPLASGTGIIGAGLNSTLAFDQRGIARPTSGASDLGAVQTYSLTVTTIDDSTNPGTTCTAGDPCSLRDAITLADSHGSGDVVTATGLQGTISLGSPLPDVNGHLNIVGPGANALTISGGNTTGVFNITDPNAISNFSGLTIANGLGGASTDGGGISNSGSQLTLSNCAFAGNNTAVGSFGGGLANLNPAGSATVTNCTFFNNHSQSGGAIFSEGSLVVTNSTFTWNTVPNGNIGGGIYNEGSLAVYDSTLSGNSAGQGSGIMNQGTATVLNSIVAGNSSNTPGDDCGSCGTQNAFNLIATTSAPITAAQLMLGPLAYNGLNQTVQTLLPFPGSPVIQAGDPTQLPANLTTDERLLPRTINSKLDLGAVQTNYTGLQFVQQPSNTTVGTSINPAVTISVTESGTTALNVPIPVTFIGPGVLNGTLTQSTVAPATLGDPAVASFGNLNGDTPGTGDTLTATLTVTPVGITPVQTLSATSNPFDITALAPPVTLDFTLTRTSAESQTVISGATATIAVQVAPTSGAYPGVVSFTATGLPAGATATFTPATVAADGGPTAVNVSVQTASLLSASDLGRNVTPIALGLLLLPLAGVKRKRLLRGGGAAGRYLFMAVLLLAGAAATAGLTGCGTGNGFFGHAPKTYNITITATSAAIQHSVNATLNVQ